MKKNLKLASIIILSLCIAFLGCGKEDYTLGELSSPSKPIINVDIIGKSDALPNGDGSGKVLVTVVANNTINYKIDFGDGSTVVSTLDTASHSYKHIGTDEFTIVVYVSGKGGNSSAGRTTISVLRTFDPNPELVTMLTNDDTKTWVVDAVSPGHLGVGPGPLAADADGNVIAETFTPDWWSAPANDKDGAGLYDDEYTFKKEGEGGGLFTHTTNSDLFGKGEYLKDFDPALAVTGDYTLSGSTAANYSEKFYFDGEDKKEYIFFSKKGHMGIYVGGHRFEVLKRSATEMTLRCLEVGNKNAWYVKIKAK